jgi:HEPN domain-containing protein
LIENISRMTTQAQNSCLKFFEEPWEGNIIILTNNSESWVLETILSRVQTISVSKSSHDWYSEFYYDMMYSYIEQQSDEIIRYMFSAKLEKTEYVEFLKALLEYISKNRTHIWLLDEIHEDINGILKNNLQGKYIVDKYIMKLSS